MRWRCDSENENSIQTLSSFCLWLGRVMCDYKYCVEISINSQSTQEKPRITRIQRMVTNVPLCQFVFICVIRGSFSGCSSSYSLAFQRNHWVNACHAPRR